MFFMAFLVSFSFFLSNCQKDQSAPFQPAAETEADASSRSDAPCSIEAKSGDVAPIDWISQFGTAENLCLCGETYGTEEPVEIPANSYYSYPDIILRTIGCSPSASEKLVTVTFNAMSVPNRFIIRNPSGAILINTGYISFKKTVTLCIPDCSVLSVRAYNSKTYPVDDVWSASFQNCQNCNSVD